MSPMNEESYKSLRALERDERIAKASEMIGASAQESAQELGAELNRIRDQFANELDGLGEAQLKYCPAEGQWSIYEVGLHVAGALRRTAMLSSALAHGHAPKIDGEIKMGVLMEDPGDFDGVKKALSDGFEKMAAATERVGGECNLEAVFPHPIFKDYNCRQWVAFNLFHMLIHVNQIRRIKASDGFPAI